MKTVFIYGTGGQFAPCRSALRHAGARVLLTRDLYRSFDCDALVLPGDMDLGPRLDAVDSFLLQSFVASSRPVLGIGRGMQAINVYFGGTLCLARPGHLGEDLLHPTRTWGPLRRVLGDAPIVTSSHTRSVALLGHQLCPIQWTEDGTVEAIAHATRNILGVQWHPERQAYALRRPDCVDAGPLFAYFLSL